MKSLRIKKTVLRNRIIAALLALVSIGSLATAALPQTAYAAADIDSVNKVLSQEYRAWASFNALSICLAKSAPASLERGTDQYSKVAGYWTTGDGEIPVGNVVDAEDGYVNCNDGADMMILLRNVGYKSLNEFNSDFFPQSDSNCPNEDCAPIPVNQMKANIQAKIKANNWGGPVNDSAVYTLSDAAQYWFWKYQLMETCGATKYATKGSADAVNGFYREVRDKKNEAVPDENISAWLVENNELTEYKYFTFEIMDRNGIKELGFDTSTTASTASVDSDAEAINCVEIANKLTKARATIFFALVTTAVEDCVAAGSTKAECVDASKSDIDNSLPGVTSTEDAQSCEALGGDTGWWTCPIVKLLSSALSTLDKQLGRLLSVDQTKYASDAMYNTWVQFRNLGLSLLIAAMLVMVISTALGVSFLDAYTVKKAFPRMVASVIFLLLSWQFCIYLIYLSNVVGQGTLGLITSPFGAKAQTLASLFNPSDVTQAIEIGGGLLLTAGAFGITGALGLIGSWLLAGLLVMGIAFIVLIARQMFIVVLILGGPIAILAWIFPGNDKLWKIWWSSFTKLLLMYPLIMALIGSGRIFSGVIADTTSAGLEGAILNPLLKITAYIIPYAFIPFTFKAAGGAFGNLAGMVNDRSRGAFDRLKKGRQKNQAEIAQRMGAGVGFRGGRATGGLNRLASGIGTGPRGWVDKNYRRGKRESKLTALGASSTKNNAVYEANKNNDAFLLAMASEDVAKQKIADARAKSLDTSRSAEDRAKYAAEVETRQRALSMAQSVRYKDDSMRRQAALDLAATGYQFSAGEDGYNELAAIGKEIHGDDLAAYGSFMNNAQYNLKGAGRTDIAGINHGAGYSFEKGWAKQGLYQIANGKADTITAAGTHYSKLLSEAQSGTTVDMDGNTVALSAQEIESRYLDAAVVDQELSAMLPNATGGVRDEILKQQAAIRTQGGQAYQNWLNRASGQTQDVRDPSTGAIIKKPIAMREIASRRARTYERPDQNRI